MLSPDLSRAEAEELRRQCWGVFPAVAHWFLQHPASQVPILCPGCGRYRCECADPSNQHPVRRPT